MRVVLVTVVVVYRCLSGFRCRPVAKGQATSGGCAGGQTVREVPVPSWICFIFYGLLRGGSSVTVTLTRLVVACLL